MDVLKEIEIVKQLASILKTNVRACKALNHAYVNQLGRIYLDMLNVYKVSVFKVFTLLLIFFYYIIITFFILLKLIEYNIFTPLIYSKFVILKFNSCFDWISVMQLS